MTRDSYGDAYQRGFVHTVRFLISRGVPGDTAQEVAQSAWTKGWEKRGQLRNDGMVVTWVNAIAMNAYRGILRREPFFVPVPELCTTETSGAAVDVGRILGFCRPRDRDLLELQLQGLTAKEIARKEGVTATTIRIRLLRARRKVRSHFARRKTPTGESCEIQHNAG
jgi:DNA-directed RNA polymerase specialized sigma24 family protein